MGQRCPRTSIFNGYLGLTQDYTKALSYFDKSSSYLGKWARIYLKFIRNEKCSANDYYALAYIFNSYELVELDYEKSLMMMEKAYQGGHPRAKEGYHSFLDNMAKIYGTPTYIAEFCAQRMYELFNDKSGYQHVVKHLLQDAEKCGGEKSKRLLEKALKYGSPDAAYELAYLAYCGDDYEKASALYDVAIQMGYKVTNFDIKKEIRQRKLEEQRKMEEIKSLQRRSEAEYANTHNRSSDLSGYIIGGALIAGAIAIINSFNSGSSSNSSTSSSSYSTSSYSTSSSSSRSSLQEGDYVECMLWRDGTCGYRGRVAGKNGDKVRVYIDDVILKGLFTFWIPACQETGWRELRYVHGYDYDFNKEYWGRGDIIEVPEWCLSK